MDVAGEQREISEDRDIVLKHLDKPGGDGGHQP